MSAGILEVTSVSSGQVTIDTKLASKSTLHGVLTSPPVTLWAEAARAATCARASPVMQLRAPLRARVKCEKCRDDTESAETRQRWLVSVVGGEVFTRS